MKRNQNIGAILAKSSVPVLGFSRVILPALRPKKGFKIYSGEGRIHGSIKMKAVNSNILDVKV